MIEKVKYKDYIWKPQFDLSGYGIWQRMQMEKTYKAAVPARIAAAKVSIPKETEDVYSAAIEAIVRFDSELSQKSITMPQILLRSESASSSQIEHLSASARNIAMAELGGTSKQNAALVAGNIRAMQKALSQSGKMTKKMILSVHKSLLETTDPEIAGKFRTQQVWIGGRGFSPHSANFVPPHQSLVKECISDWTAFANRTDIHGLLKTAIAHCQFETIHPFIDGNGRTGRAIMQIMLHESGLIRKSALPISAGLLSDVAKYFGALTAYRDGDYTKIVEQICLAAIDAVDISRNAVRRFEALHERWEEKVTARKDAVVWKLLDLLLTQPVIDAKYVSEHLGVSDPAARGAIGQLKEAGILKNINRKIRGTIYEASEVTKLFDSFAVELGRRR